MNIIAKLAKMRREHPKNMWIRRETVPRGHHCSLCRRATRAMVVITVGRSPFWWGACLRCVDELGEAAER